MLSVARKANRTLGFTLIELSIVLVVIGLVVGGVLVGQDLISAAGVRAQIAQIEKYQSAVNTFRGKYNNTLPGDMDAVNASRFGFAARGVYAGEGDGNGIIEGIDANAPSSNDGTNIVQGETAMFWVDLAQARLVDGGFNVGSATGAGMVQSTVSATGVSSFFPPAKLGSGNYVYVWSGGWTLSAVSNNTNDGYNYFGVSNISGISNSISSSYPQALSSNLALTVKQAYSIDTKIDDGLPQTGRVLALYISPCFGGFWAGNSVCSPSTISIPNIFDVDHTPQGGPITSTSVTNSATPINIANCYDNNNTTGGTERYSITTNNGTGYNCALSFKFQ